MSNRRCNKCVYDSLKRAGHRRIKRADTEYELGGVNVYLIPKGEKLDTKKHFAAWFMSLPERCEC